MKNLVIVLSAIAALSYLAPIIVFAEPTHPNEVGLYTTPDGYGATGTYEVGVPVDVYLVLTKPTYLDGGLPFDNVSAFDGQLNFNPIGGIFKLGEIFPDHDRAWNIGDADHIEQGYLEYIVVWPEDAPVINDCFVLISFSFMNTNAWPVEVTLSPCSLPTIDGQMCFLSWDFGDSHLEIMHPVSGSNEAPVFIFNGAAVPVETESFGSVKALYR